jgi:hypothetical protein
MAEEIKDSKKIENFHFHLAKKWHDKWSKIVINCIGISLWLLLIGGLIFVSYAIYRFINFLTSL